MIVDHLASPAVAGFSVSKIRGQGPVPMKRSAIAFARGALIGIGVCSPGMW
jgi:hypothetical protein